MKGTLCRKLAFSNIKKHGRFFIPRILSEMGLLMCFYIIYTLAIDGRLREVKGGEYLPTFMWTGVLIIGAMSLVLMLYTNSFLMKQRKSEFGLYSVLGMEKRHILRVLLWESLFCSVIAVALGLIGGVLFYKLSSLGICKLLKAEIVAGFYYIKPITIIPPAVAFILMDALIYGINVLRIHRMNPLDLLKDAHTGEKEPKVKWPIFIIGLITLGAGYTISIITTSPLEAILLFMAAVILVIIGTYCLYVAGSIFVLKVLKKRDSTYYRPGYMTAISGLLYRMKQNAVGLASVAILSTGVLVMLSSTCCLYSRTEEVLKTNYPQDYYISASFFDENDVAHVLDENVIEPIIKEAAKDYGLKITSFFRQDYLEVAYSYHNGEMISDRESIANETDLSGLCNNLFITEETYVKLGGEPLHLKEDEVALCPYSMEKDPIQDAFVLEGKHFRVAKRLMVFPIRIHMISVNCYGIVVKDDDVLNAIYEGQKAAYGENASEYQHRYAVSFEDQAKALEVGDTFSNRIDEQIEAIYTAQGYSGYSRDSDSIWDARSSLYGMYGTLLFLGILLGLVCLFAAVLVIYYKQISEGYEDRSRYQIMQKIGMTDREVKKTIRTQIMMVFFLPLITAGIHIAFAYPILTRLMKILLLADGWLFAKWCLVVYLIFAVVYALIYKLTAKTYYDIVY